MSYEKLQAGKETVCLRISNNADSFGLETSSRLVFLNENLPNEGTRQMSFYDNGYSDAHKYGQIRFVTTHQRYHENPTTEVMIAPLRDFLAMEKPDTLDSVSASLKHARAFERKLIKMTQEQGHEINMRDSLVRIAKATKAKYFFAHRNPLDSEIRYPISALPGLIDHWIDQHQEKYPNKAA